MSMERKALIVTTRGAGAHTGLDALNEALRQGWRVAHLTPMGGGEAPTLAALVILRRSSSSSTEMVEEAEKEAEEVLDEIVEEGPANPELPEERNGGPPT